VVPRADMEEAQEDMEDPRAVGPSQFQVMQHEISILQKLQISNSFFQAVGLLQDRAQDLMEEAHHMEEAREDSGALRDGLSQFPQAGHQAEVAHHMAAQVIFHSSHVFQFINY